MAFHMHDYRASLRGGRHPSDTRKPFFCLFETLVRRPPLIHSMKVRAGIVRRRFVGTQFSPMPQPPVLPTVSRHYRMGNIVHPSGAHKDRTATLKTSVSAALYPQSLTLKPCTSDNRRRDHDARKRCSLSSRRSAVPRHVIPRPDATPNGVMSDAECRFCHQWPGQQPSLIKVASRRLETGELSVNRNRIFPPCMSARV